MKNRGIPENIKKYRKSSIVLSVTFILISIASILGGVWLGTIGEIYRIPSFIIVHLFQIISLGLTIIACLSFLFCSYQDHKFIVRSQTNKSMKVETEDWLFKEDVSLYFSLIFFTVGIILSGIIYFSILDQKGYIG